MSNKKLKFVLSFIVCLLVFAFTFRIIFYKNLPHTLKPKVSLQYCKEVISVQISDQNGEISHITNPIAIEDLLTYLNSLVLIEKERPSINYNEFDEMGYFSILLINKNGMEYDSIAFSTEYLLYYEDGLDLNCKSYYIVDSGYKADNRSSKIYDYVKEIISLHADK